jgi:ATP-dependent DNA helicase RecG
MTNTDIKAHIKLDLSMPVQYLKGVGPARAMAFAQLGVHTVADLLEYFPRDWNFTPSAVKICQMQPGEPATTKVTADSHYLKL